MKKASFITRMSTSWDQVKFALAPKSKGFHLITNEVLREVPQIGEYKVGQLNLFIQHTSAGLSINENYDPDVRTDLINIFDRIVPDNEEYIHIMEGLDDAKSHGQASITGLNVNIPISNGRLALGTWQGIYLGEFRKNRPSRKIVATISGIKG